MSDRRIFVLGANSFSGQDFVDLLLDDPNNRVTGISRSDERSDLFLKYKLRSVLAQYRYLKMDVNRDMPAILELMDRDRPSIVVNYAAQSEVGPSWDNPDHWYQTNTVAMSKLANHLARRDYPKRFIQISSAEAYGNCIGRVDEDTPDNPSTPYAASRSATDVLFATYHRQYGFPVITVRPTNVYGARQQLFKIIPRAAIYLRRKKPIPLHGGGHAVKSYIHVRDVSRGVRTILESGVVGDRYHLSPDQGVAVRDVVRSICDVAGFEFEKAVDSVDDRPGQDARYEIDSTKTRTLGWKPEISFDQGLAEVLQWVEDYWQQIKTHPLDYIHKA